MNIHHLELFYYVARHGGIMEAVRNIPYGIQQPAVSGQVAQLEEYLGVVLFQRRPFALTPAGEKLYRFIEPFFANLEAMAKELQGGKEHQLRIGASHLVLRDHLPELFRQMRKKYPQLRVALQEGYPAELQRMLEREELDLAVTVLEKQAAPGMHSLPLIELPLVLLIEKHSALVSAEELWQRDRIQEPLISLPAAEAISKHFQQGLGRRGVDWFPSLEVSSIDLVEAYVANGFGIGVSVLLPKTVTRPGVRSVPLPGFAPVVVGALWRKRSSALLPVLLEQMQLGAQRLG